MEKENCTEVYKDPNGYHKIRKMQSFPIGFYKNGIALKGFPFFKYGTADSMQILADILEGYFPYQLKKQFPNGTLLSMVDKTDEDYDNEKLNACNIHNVDENQLKPISKQEYLDKLPKQVITSKGNVVEVRSEISKILDVAPK